MLLGIFGIGLTELIIVGLCLAVPAAIIGVTLVVVLIASGNRRDPPGNE